MLQFSLKILFKESDLRIIYETEHQVVIAKTSGGRDNFENSIVWHAFRPVMANTVIWQNTYGIYASKKDITHGAVIECYTHIQAEPEKYEYCLSNGCFQQNNYDGGKPGTYYAKNNGGEILTFGLEQSIDVNGQLCEPGAINAIRLLNNEEVLFKPEEKVKVFLARNAQNGEVITQAQTEALTIDLTQNPDRSLAFDGDRSQFYIMEA